MGNVTSTATGLSATLMLAGPGPNLFGADINPLRMDVDMETRMQQFDVHAKLNSVV